MVLQLIADDDTTARPFDGYFGPTTLGEALVEFYVMDSIVNRWDLATSTGSETRLTEAELDLIETGADSWGDALYMEGICVGGVEAPEGADRQTRVLARMGRSAN